MDLDISRLGKNPILLLYNKDVIHYLLRIKISLREKNNAWRVEMLELLHMYDIGDLVTSDDWEDRVLKCCSDIPLSEDEINQILEHLNIESEQHKLYKYEEEVPDLTYWNIDDLLSGFSRRKKEFLQTEFFIG
eukprot:TRINITY_DN3449_c0_g1_i3.p1 TRINITY_DN3449_c0_g1~~TRINITY_DN3449_c0_g1_i3.p1  ORF type:complete len:133 (+),score=34.20 TRINITY_DN3449_c0_g1_i3:230-628(+)